MTDYPDAPLIDNLRTNIAALRSFAPKSADNIVAEPYLWGNPLPESLAPVDGFDLVILSDLLFNHSEHAKLLKTVVQTLRRAREARALVFFTPHRPWLLEKDLAFLTLLDEAGLSVEKVVEEVLEKPMFEEDKGVSLASRCSPFRAVVANLESQDRDLRRTVFGYEVSWKENVKN